MRHLTEMKRIFFGLGVAFLLFIAMAVPPGSLDAQERLVAIDSVGSTGATIRSGSSSRSPSVRRVPSQYPRSVWVRSGYLTRRGKGKSSGAVAKAPGNSGLCQPWRGGAMLLWSWRADDSGFLSWPMTGATLEAIPPSPVWPLSDTLPGATCAPASRWRLLGSYRRVRPLRPSPCSSSALTTKS